MNHPFDLLQANLLDLLHELRTSDIRLIIGGGYGLYLKHKLIEKTSALTLLSFIPAARSTDDLDVFLSTQVMVDVGRAKVVLEAMRALQYVVVKDKENFQFIKEFDYDGRPYHVKLDFLTKMPDEPSEIGRLDIQRVRIRNKTSGGIHAHLTVEAIAIEDNPAPVEVRGSRTTGEEYNGEVYIPQAYTYLMMKLFAFRDWETEKQKPSYARKHALDLYTIIAMMTEAELAVAETSSQKYRQMPEAQEAAQIVDEFFSQATAVGTIRLREHQSFNRSVDLTEFMSVLNDLFPRQTLTTRGQVR